MSFILDALKKSENDRQRQTGPALFEVRVAAPKSKFPVLAVSIVSLLVVNLGVVGWLMLRKPATAAVPPQPAPQTTAVNPAPPPTQQLQQAPQPQQQNPQAAYAPGPAPQGGQGYDQQQPVGTQPPPSSYSQQAYNNPPPTTAFSQQPNQQGANPAYPAQGGFVTREPMLADENPDDYAPAREAPPPGQGAGRVVQSTDSGLPTYEEAATRTSIPPIHMDLHSYAPDPSKRFVLINMKRLYEGQSLPEGVKVESITNDGAILSYSGVRFVLDSD